MDPLVTAEEPETLKRLTVLGWFIWNVVGDGVHVRKLSPKTGRRSWSLSS